MSQDWENSHLAADAADSDQHKTENTFGGALLGALIGFCVGFVIVVMYLKVGCYLDVCYENWEWGYFLIGPPVGCVGSLLGAIVGTLIASGYSVTKLLGILVVGALICIAVFLLKARQAAVENRLRMVTVRVSTETQYHQYVDINYHGSHENQLLFKGRPWELEFEAHKGSVPFVSARNNTDAPAPLMCEIQVDGQIVKSSVTREGYKTVTCSVRVP
jgi:hypothetical protein